jgi:hypothetical protein
MKKNEYCYDYQNQMGLRRGGARRTHERDKNFVKNVSRLKERDHVEDLVVDGIVILKGI